MMNKWIQETRQRQDVLQITKFNSLDSLMDHLNQQKVSSTHSHIWSSVITSVTKSTEVLFQIKLSHWQDNLYKRY